MKQTFKALLSRVSMVVFLFSATDIHARNEESFQDSENGTPFELTGYWQFERGEYLEQSSPGQEYQLKSTIETEEELFSVGSCFQDVIGGVFFYNDEAKVSCMYNTYIGKYVFPMDFPSSPGEKKMMVFGDDETLGQASLIEDMVFNAPHVDYLFEYVDPETIIITIERSCYQNGVTIQGAVKCVLTRESSNTY